MKPLGVRAAAWAAALLGAIGCGGGGTSKAPGDFIGLWTSVSTQTTTVCDGTPVTSSPFIPNVIAFSEGTSADLVLQDIDAASGQPLNGGCSYDFDVGGDNATMVGTQVCNPDATSTVTWTKDIFTLSGDGAALHEIGSAASVSSTMTCNSAVDLQYERTSV